jgi:hypothetical protein
MFGLMKALEKTVKILVYIAGGNIGAGIICFILMLLLTLTTIDIDNIKLLMFWLGVMLLGTGIPILIKELTT